MRTHDRNLTRTKRRYSTGVLAAAMIGMAVTLWGQEPVLLMNNQAAILSWKQGDSSYILTESPTVDGLYTPSLLPLIFGGNRATVVTSEPPMQFFKLAQGGQVLEDFSRGTNYAWTLRYLEEPDEGKWQASYPSGTLRIRQVGAASGPISLSPPVWTSGNQPNCGDVSMSVDIVDWDENALAMVGFGARAVNNPGQADHGNGYWPRITLRRGGSSLWNGRLTEGGFYDIGSAENFSLVSKRPLRLVYSLAGDLHRFSVFDLADGTLIEAVTPSLDDTYDKGLFLCLWIGFDDNSNPDITLDNIVTTWTSP